MFMNYPHIYIIYIYILYIYEEREGLHKRERDYIRERGTTYEREGLHKRERDYI